MDQIFRPIPIFLVSFSFIFSSSEGSFLRPSSFQLLVDIIGRTLITCSFFFPSGIYRILIFEFQNVAFCFFWIWILPSSNSNSTGVTWSSSNCQFQLLNGWLLEWLRVQFPTPDFFFGGGGRGGGARDKAWHSTPSLRMSDGWGWVRRGKVEWRILYLNWVERSVYGRVFLRSNFNVS